MIELIKKIFKVACANGIQVVAGIVLGFLVPKYLSIHEYGQFKTYTLLVSYIGILNFGFVDGIYIDYGGKSLNKINRSQLRGELVFSFVLEFVITIICLMLSVVFEIEFGVLVAISIIPYNINTFFKRLYQSTDELERYTKDVIVYTLVNFVFCVYFIYVLQSHGYMWYCMATVIANLVIVFLESKYIFRITRKATVLFQRKRYNTLIKSGFIIMMGNIVVNMFYGIDRWVVKIFFESDAFSYYSFAVSMFNIVVSILQAISLSLFSFFSKKENKDKLVLTKDLILVVGVISSCTYFALVFIVQRILPEYNNSLSIIAITMAIFPYMLYITSITINLYKINKQEKKYLYTIILMLGLVCILDLLVVPYKRMECIALATLLCYIGWFIYSRMEDKKLIPLSIREVVYLVINTTIFLLTANYQNIYASIIYFLVCVISSIIYIYPEIKMYLLRGNKI